jgi:hypothetical protein
MTPEQTQTEPAAPAYEAEAIYRVALRRPATLDGLRYLPRDEHTFVGAHLTRLIEENGAHVVDNAVRR